MASDGAVVGEHLGRYASIQDGFIAVNTAFTHDGAVVEVPEDTEVETPVHLVFVSSGASPDRVSYPRVLVLAGRDSRLRLVDSYVGPAEGRYFTNAVVEIAASEGAGARALPVHRRERQGIPYRGDEDEAGCRRFVHLRHRGDGRPDSAKRSERADGCSGRIVRAPGALFHVGQPAHRQPHRHRPREAELHERPVLQGHPRREVARRCSAGGCWSGRTPRRRRRTSQTRT